MRKELTDSEVNQIIAEFMGWKFRGVDGSGNLQLEMPPMRGISFHKPYTKSLDALVPVWEKLHFEVMFDTIPMEKGIVYHECRIYAGKAPVVVSCYNKPQQTAAHATAKAILDLKK